MAEGWVECPALGPGWKRREAFRKSGATCGRTDTYYQSPTGQKFRSKIELSRFLGPNRDLSNFDFKNGTEKEEGKPHKGPKWQRLSETPLKEPPQGAEPETKGAEPKAQGAEPKPQWAEPKDQGAELQPDLKQWQGAELHEKGAELREKGAEPVKGAELQTDWKQWQGAELHGKWAELHEKGAGSTKGAELPGKEAELHEKGAEPKAQGAGLCEKGVELHEKGAELPVKWAGPAKWAGPRSGAQPIVVLLREEGAELMKKGVELSKGAEPALTTPPAEATPPLAAPPLPLPTRRTTRKRPPPAGPPTETTQEGTAACCASCQRLFPGMTLPPQRRCRWLCPQCRAQRRDFNREQRFYKRVGCGACQACLMPEDCGICSACTRRAPPPLKPPPQIHQHQHLTGPPPNNDNDNNPPPPTPKCLLRRCLRIVKKSVCCGSCPGCRLTEDCGSCCICLRRLRPGLKRQWRCMRRRCTRAKGSGQKLKAAVKQPQKEKKKPGRPPKQHGAHGDTRCRSRRRCGCCRGCRRGSDCGRCDFCRDKPKFGGRNLKRQKCRWRQCLQRAMRQLLPSRPPHAATTRSCPPRQDMEPMGGDEKVLAPPHNEELRTPPRVQPPLQLLIASAPRPKVEPTPNTEHTVPRGLGLLIAAAPKLKQEPPPPCGSLVPVPPLLPPPDLLLLDESDDERDQEQGRPRVPLPLPPPWWPHSFLSDLSQTPLPAHWRLLSSLPPPLKTSGVPLKSFPLCNRAAYIRSPHLRLMQRSPRSPMAAAVVLLGPALSFRVVLAERRPVPPGHQLLARRRLRGVDDLVELLCDLEAYGACPGPPGGVPGPHCHVLSPPGGRCDVCRAQGEAQGGHNPP